VRFNRISADRLSKSTLACPPLELFHARVDLDDRPMPSTPVSVVGLSDAASQSGLARAAFTAARPSCPGVALNAAAIAALACGVCMRSSKLSLRSLWSSWVAIGGHFEAGTRSLSKSSTCSTDTGKPAYQAILPTMQLYR